MTSCVTFDLLATSGPARYGKLHTPHGMVATPAFMPVATQGSVKTLTTDEVRAMGAEIILANAYHLYLQPGVELVRDLGGLHRFCVWDGPILTDSGGFQAYSLGNNRKITDDGITFRSHIDGSSHYFTPEAAVEYQLALGADIAMCLDQCIAHGVDRELVKQAMDRTHSWARRCKEFHGRTKGEVQQSLFGIVQGGLYADLRKESAGFITSLDFDGYAVGGLGVGEAKAPMYEMATTTTELLPRNKPRYLMGVGSPEDLVEGVASGIDLFDCALPTRVARNGGLFTSTGRVDIKHRRFRDVSGPLEEECDCYGCTRFSAAYLRHLFKAGELLGPRLATIHNLRFVLRLMEQIRDSIRDGRFSALREEFLGTYVPTDEKARLDQKRRWMSARGMVASS